MDAKFQPEDHQFVHQMAQEADIGREMTKQKARLELEEQKIQGRQTASKERKEKAAMEAERLATVPLILDKEGITKLKGAKLKEHLLAFKINGAPNLEAIKVTTLVDKIREALHAAIDSFKNGDWEPIKHSVVDTSSDEGGEDTEWEDESD
jgi:hypothetical protein